MEVTDQKQVETAVEKALSKFNRLDVVVNNAGFGILGAIEEISNEETKKQYDTNVFGVFKCYPCNIATIEKTKVGSHYQL